MRKKRYQVISWLAVILWMVLIFYLSHQPATESSELSAGLTAILFSLLEKVVPFTGLDWEVFHFLIRKGAHFFAYFMLGIFVLHALRSSQINGLKEIVFALCICVLYAVSDEFHQLFIPGRSGEVRDILIDSMGAFVGIALYKMICSLLKIPGT